MHIIAKQIKVTKIIIILKQQKEVNNDGKQLLKTRTRDRKGYTGVGA